MSLRRKRKQLIAAAMAAMMTVSAGVPAVVAAAPTVFAEEPQTNLDTSPATNPSEAAVTGTLVCDLPQTVTNGGKIGNTNVENLSDLLVKYEMDTENQEYMVEERRLQVLGLGLSNLQGTVQGNTLKISGVANEDQIKASTHDPSADGSSGLVRYMVKIGNLLELAEGSKDEYCFGYWYGDVTNDKPADWTYAEDGSENAEPLRVIAEEESGAAGHNGTYAVLQDYFYKDNAFVGAGNRSANIQILKRTPAELNGTDTFEEIGEPISITVDASQCHLQGDIVTGEGIEVCDGVTADITAAEGAGNPTITISTGENGVDKTLLLENSTVDVEVYVTDDVESITVESTTINKDANSNTIKVPVTFYDKDDQSSPWVSGDVTLTLNKKGSGTETVTLTVATTGCKAVTPTIVKNFGDLLGADKATPSTLFTNFVTADEPTNSANNRINQVPGSSNFSSITSTITPKKATDGADAPDATIKLTGKVTKSQAQLSWHPHGMDTTANEGEAPGAWMYVLVQVPDDIKGNISVTDSSSQSGKKAATAPVEIGGIHYASFVTPFLMGRDENSDKTTLTLADDAIGVSKTLTLEWTDTDDAAHTYTIALDAAGVSVLPEDENGCSFNLSPDIQLAEGLEVKLLDNKEEGSEEVTSCTIKVTGYAAEDALTTAGATTIKVLATVPSGSTVELNPASPANGSVTMTKNGDTAEITIDIYDSASHTFLKGESTDTDGNTIASTLDFALKVTPKNESTAVTYNFSLDTLECVVTDVKKDLGITPDATTGDVTVSNTALSGAITDEIGGDITLETSVPTGNGSLTLSKEAIAVLQEKLTETTDTPEDGTPAPAAANSITISVKDGSDETYSWTFENADSLKGAPEGGYNLTVAVEKNTDTQSADVLSYITLGDAAEEAANIPAKLKVWIPDALLPEGSDYIDLYEVTGGGTVSDTPKYNVPVIDSTALANAASRRLRMERTTTPPTKYVEIPQTANQTVINTKYAVKAGVENTVAGTPSVDSSTSKQLKVTGITVTGSSAKSLMVSTSSNAASATPVGTAQNITSATSTTPYTFTDLADGTTYYFYYKIGDGSWQLLMNGATPLSATTKTTAGTDDTDTATLAGATATPGRGSISVSGISSKVPYVGVYLNRQFVKAVPVENGNASITGLQYLLYIKSRSKHSGKRGIWFDYFGNYLAP